MEAGQEAAVGEAMAGGTETEAAGLVAAEGWVGKMKAEAAAADLGWAAAVAADWTKAGWVAVAGLEDKRLVAGMAAEEEAEMEAEEMEVAGWEVATAGWEAARYGGLGEGGSGGEGDGAGGFGGAAAAGR